MFQNIIFDWSGVINDNSLAVYQTVTEILNIKGLSTKISLEEFKKNWVQPYMDFYHKFLPDFTQEEQAVLYKKTLIKYEEDKIYKDIDKLVKKFFENKINLFAISSDYPENLLNQVKLFNMDGLFKEIVYGVYDKTIAAESLIKKYNLVLDNTIFIGDSNHEIEAGKKNNIKTCAVTWGIATKDNLKSFHPDFIVDNLKELEHVILKSDNIN